MSFEGIRTQLIPAGFRTTFSSPRLLPFLKPDPDDILPPSLDFGVRPIGIPSILRRAATRPDAIAASLEWAARLTTAGQFGLGVPSGVEGVARALQLSLELNPTLAIISEDCRNAFNTLRRDVIADTLLRLHYPLLAPFLAYYGTQPFPQYLRQSDGYLTSIPSQTGGIQGDSIFSAVFDITYRGANPPHR